MKLAVCPAGIEQRTFELIMGWDMLRVKQKLINERGVTAKYADQAEREWKKYVVMALVHPGIEFPMGEPVDEIAHEHLLDTRNFRAFCNAIHPGLRIDHQPTVDEQERTELLPEYHSVTIPVMEHLFGEINQEFWPRERCVCKWMAVVHNS